jgi:endoribonuclease Dicer
LSRLSLSPCCFFQVFIRDQAFDPLRFYALGRPCPTVCTKENEDNIHLGLTSVEDKSSASATDIRCNKNHHWLYRKTIADVVEALVGAFIVDSGFKAAIAFLAWIGIEVNFEASQLVNICTASVGYFPLSAEVDIPSLEGKLGHHFVHKGLLLQAFVHPSYNKHGGGCYQVSTFLLTPKVLTPDKIYCLYFIALRILVVHFDLRVFKT